MCKVAILFPGQGTQYTGMGRNLCERYPVADRTFEEASEALKYDLKKLCFEGSINELTKLENAQPAILTVSVAAFRVYMDIVGIEPYLALGHSFGEISALSCVGAIDFFDAVRIAKARGSIMQETATLGEGAMAAVNGVDEEIVRGECRRASKEGKLVVIANFNTKDQVVISGHREAVEKVAERLRKVAGNIVMLKVKAPCHSPIMEPAAIKLEQELLKYKYNDFICPVISNRTAISYRENEKIVPNLVKQLYRPVKWRESMKYVRDTADYCIEFGPKTVLKNLQKKEHSGLSVLSMDDNNDMETILGISNNLGKRSGVGVKILEKCLATVSSTKNCNFNSEEYEEGVIKQCQFIRNLQEEAESKERELPFDQVKEGLKALKKILDTKKVPMDEQKKRFDEVFKGSGWSIPLPF